MSYVLHIVTSCFNFHTVAIFLAVFILSAYYVSSLTYRYNLPPGPWNVPFIGNFLGLVLRLYRTGDKPEYQLAEIAKRYGDVFTLRIGSKIIVIANGYKSIKEAYQNPLISDRPKSTIFEELSLGEGVGTASGKAWQYQRAFTLKTFRNLGVGRSRFEINIRREAQTLLSVLRQQDGTPYDPNVIIGNCVTNVVSAVVLGTRYEHSDPEFQHLLHVNHTVVNKMRAGGVVLFLPILRYVLPKTYRDIVDGFNDFAHLIEGAVKHHQNVFDEDSINDFIDVYLKEIETAKNETSDRCEFLNLKSLSATAVFLIMPGMETTKTSLRWAFLYLMEHPEIQSKVQQEMDEVIGRNQMPQWADRLKLPYTEAVLLEVQRIRTVVPIGVPHVASQDTELYGYDIPKGTIVVPNIWAVHNDPCVWSEPDRFKPETFLDEHGKLRHREQFIPFSIGQRVCLGENLAKMELFLFFTYILHSFNIKKSPGERYSFKGIGGFSLNPLHFKIIAEQRL